jgi:hypothetical protein
MKRPWVNARDFRDPSILPSPSGKPCQGPSVNVARPLSSPKCRIGIGGGG